MLIAARGRDIVHLGLILNIIELTLKATGQSARYKRTQFLAPKSNRDPRLASHEYSRRRINATYTCNTHLVLP